MSSMSSEKKGMLYPSMSKLKTHIPNRYMLVNVVALRARQIAQDAEDTGTKLSEKPVSMAIDEVAQGKLDTSSMDLVIEDPEDLPNMRSAK